MELDYLKTNAQQHWLAGQPILGEDASHQQEMAQQETWECSSVLWDVMANAVEPSLAGESPLHTE